MIEAHKHALQLAAPGAFAELAEGERFFSAASLSILPDWHVAAREMWLEASRAAQRTLAEIAPA